MKAHHVTQPACGDWDCTFCSEGVTYVKILRVGASLVYMNRNGANVALV